MSNFENSGPAFPCETVGADEHGEYRLPWQGMTLRDYFAAKAMQGMWASDTEAWHCSGTKDALASRAIDAYAMADAMLAANDPAPVQASKAAPDLLDILIRARDAIEALDGTTIENERLVDDYRAAIAKAKDSHHG